MSADSSGGVLSSTCLAAAKQVLERTPPELSADIIDRGVIITGGGALLNGLDQLLAEELKVPVLVGISHKKTSFSKRMRLLISSVCA